MNNLLKKHSVAVLALVLAVILVVPISANISLNKSIDKCYSFFEKNAIKDQGHGWTLSATMNTMMDAVSDFLNIVETDFDVDKSALKDAKSLVEKYNDSKKYYQKYEICLDAYSAVDTLYRSLGSDSTDNINLVGQYNSVTSAKSKIFNFANVDFEEALSKENKITSKFPANIIYGALSEGK